MEVSVIIPVYNAVEYIDQSIRSALIQPEVKEVIVIDDGSTDGSYERLMEWEHEEAKVQLLAHPNRERKRAGAARNLGLKKAQSEFIAFLDADDLFVNKRFDKTAALFQYHPDAEVVLEPVKKLRDNGQADQKGEQLFFLEKSKGASFFEAILLDHASNVPINGICFKRKIIERIGMMDESLDQKQDKDFLLRLCLHANIIAGDKNNVVAYYRHHNLNTTANLEEELTYQYELFSKWKNNLNNLPLSFKGKLEFIRQYVVCKYRTRNWPILKKLITYPFLITFELFKNLNQFIPTSGKGLSSHP